jgi:hypothetical protein
MMGRYNSPHFSLAPPFAPPGVKIQSPTPQIKNRRKFFRIGNMNFSNRQLFPCFDIASLVRILFAGERLLRAHFPAAITGLSRRVMTGPGLRPRAVAAAGQQSLYNGTLCLVGLLCAM